jgi:hypothetical protein
VHLTNIGALWVVGSILVGAPRMLLWKKIYLLVRMDFFRESWMLLPATDSACTYTVCFGACTGSPIVRNGHVIVCGRA